MTNFIPHTAAERQAMLATIGVADVEALFADIPAVIQQRPEQHDLPAHGLNEWDLQDHLGRMAAHNTGVEMESFLGGGAYARFIPPAVQSIASRSEFYTAYTPYQPEISQGTLQMIYEFQTMMAELTGMDVSNASVYDGATAVAESALMALRATRRRTLYVSKTLNPHYQAVLQTYLAALGEIDWVAFDPHEAFPAQVTGDPRAIAAVLTQQPDYFGCLHRQDDIRAFCQSHGALWVASVDPMTLGVLNSPGSEGADIVCGDIQQFGNSVNYGGPYGGFVATTRKLLRQLPGRLVGRTWDKDGKTAYTLTLQTREQHIRREKATSNICTNQSLNILKAAVYMSLTGPQGLRQVVEVSTQRAHALADGLLALPGITLRHEAPFLYEFAVRLPMPASLMVKQMAHHHHILAGIDVGKYWPDEDHTLLIAVTERNSMDEIDRYITAFKALLSGHGLAVIPSRASRPNKIVATGTRGECPDA